MKSPQQSPDFPDCFYRVTVKGLCVREGKLLMVKDFSLGFYAEAGGLWELPGGGLDFGEEFHVALRREIKEEMGLTVTEIAEKPTYIWTYTRRNMREMPWFCALILAYRFELENLDFVPSEECRELKFLSKEELMQAPVGDQMEPLKELFNPADFLL